ncbi:MAG: M81 family metallopeptidase [Anaerolineae bacterium]|nr:M81 family metallopeptidase [Anaerolineae bacterium]
MPRIALGGIVHETHTFAPTVTGLAAFEDYFLIQGDAILDAMRGTRTPLGGEIAALDDLGYEIAPLLWATAMPSGLVTAEAWASLRGRLLARLRAAGPVDGVLLALHGAMVAEGANDPEGELLLAIRAIVGPDAPIVSALDMHGNLSQAAVDAADALVAFDTNPHLDTYERGREAGDILRRMVEEGLRTARALRRPPLLLSALATWTERAPLAPVHTRAQAMERNPRVVVISVMGGFAYADTPHTGMSVAVTTDGDQALADRYAEELADIAWQHRAAAAYKGEPVAEAVRRAMAAPRGPVILADVADNIGGGSPGDGTVILRALIDADAQDAVVVIADAEAVAQAWAAGVGATVALAVGSKTDHLHGAPVQVAGVVEGLTDGRFTNEGINHFSQLYGHEIHMGPCAVVRVGGVRILLTTRRTPPGDLAQLRSQGIAPEAQRIIVVKSPVAFRGAYQPIAAEIIEVDTPGLVTADLTTFAYRHLPRPIYPLDPMER